MRGSSRKSVPLVAEATRVHATSDASDKSRPRFPSEEKLQGTDGTGEGQEETKDAKVAEAPLPPDPSAEAHEDAKSVLSADSTTRPQSGAWFGWWSRPDGYGSDGEKVRNQKRKQDAEDAEYASNTPLPGTPDLKPVDPALKDDTPKAPGEDGLKDVVAERAAQWEGLHPEMRSNPNTSRSWFGLWSSAQNLQAEEEAQTKVLSESTGVSAPEITLTAEPGAPENAEKPDQPCQDVKPQQQPEGRPRSSGWAFWSSGNPADEMSNAGDTQKEIGELAVADTPSQSHPEAAQFNEQREQQRASKLDGKRASSLLRPGGRKEARGRSSSGEDSSVAATPAVSQAQTPASSHVPTPVDTPPRDDSEAPTPIKRGKLAQTRPNLILPSLRDVYPSAPNPSYLERFSQYLAQTLPFSSTQPIPAPQHVYFSTTPLKVTKAIAIGIHGFFPAQLLQKVLGQPTGTSIRFANYAAASVKAWCQEHQPDVKDVEVEKVALEGEGFISDRVTTLWKLLLNWLSHLRQADFILVACHSQGVPVAFMLIAKLIQLGCLSPHVRLGVCGMAGINLGPFIEYKSRLFGGSALELFDFCDSNSKVSKSYAEALDICLRHNVRVTFIGSLDDQLVSLESSLHAPLSHPYVSRAVFIDGKVHVPNFLTHLVVFALKLRNLGISDHGLLRELSAPLAGSLVGGDGHSRVYDDPAVYRLAVDFALETTDAPLTSPAALASPTAANSLLAHDKDRANAIATARRASLSGYPTSAAQANSIRRGDSASTHLPGIAPLIASYEPPAGGAAANPFYLPWAVRGMLEETAVKREPKMQEEVAELVKEFEDWKPTSKVLKDVRWRLEGVRSMV